MTFDSNYFQLLSKDDKRSIEWSLYSTSRIASQFHYLCYPTSIRGLQIRIKFSFSSFHSKRVFGFRYTILLSQCKWTPEYLPTYFTVLGQLDYCHIGMSSKDCIYMEIYEILFRRFLGRDFLFKWRAKELLFSPRDKTLKRSRTLCWKKIKKKVKQKSKIKKISYAFFFKCFTPRFSEKNHW